MTLDKQVQLQCSSAVHEVRISCETKGAAMPHFDLVTIRLYNRVRNYYSFVIAPTKYFLLILGHF